MHTLLAFVVAGVSGLVLGCSSAPSAREAAEGGMPDGGGSTSDAAPPEHDATAPPAHDAAAPPAHDAALPANDGGACPSDACSSSPADAGTVTSLEGGGEGGPSTWNLPTDMTVVCRTGPVTSASAGFSMPAGGSIDFGGPVPCVWTRNGGNGSIGLSSAASNPDGSPNTDVQPSGYRVMFPAGQVNDAAWDMYFDHAGGTGSYYIGWKQRWQPRGSFSALLSALDSGDSKAWAPKGPAGGDLTIMSFMGSGNLPVIGLDFQGVDDHDIPDVNQTGGSGTIPVTSAMTLPAALADQGAWDQEEILITSTGAVATSSVSLYVNGQLAGTATGVTNATAWTATEQYLSRSIYSGTETTTTYTDIDEVTVAVK
ncbi:MAG TPA: hypothetical protein VGG39_10385 [Polyangiaceae bacterium]|jgi:hypothetical protein